MRTNCIVGLAALSFMLFTQAISELNQTAAPFAHLTALSGILVTAVLAWRIEQPD